MTEEHDNGDEENGRKIVRISPTSFIVGILSVAVVVTWLYLAFRIIDGAIEDKAVLDNIEGLLTALAVLTIPTSKILEEALKKWLSEDD